MTNENTPRFESHDLTAVMSTLEVSLGEHLVGFEVIDRDLWIPALPSKNPRRTPPPPATPVHTAERQNFARDQDTSNEGPPRHDMSRDDAARHDMSRDDDDPDGARADVVGVDRSGRLVLALFVDGGDDSTVISALEVLAFARANLELAAQHWSAHGVSVERGPIVVLIAERFDARLKHVLSTVDRDALRLFEVRAMRSASSVSSYLAPCELPGSMSFSARVVPEDILSTWPDESRGLAEVITLRLGRIDDELEAGAVSDALVWRARGRAVCTLARLDGVLQGEVGSDRSAVLIRGPRDAEAFLERALREQMNAWSADFEGGEPEKRPLDILRRRSEPLLTAEEMAAFRD